MGTCSCINAKTEGDLEFSKSKDLSKIKITIRIKLN